MKNSEAMLCYILTPTHRYSNGKRKSVHFMSPFTAIHTVDMDYASAALSDYSIRAAAVPAAGTAYVTLLAHSPSAAGTIPAKNRAARLPILARRAVEVKLRVHATRVMDHWNEVLVVGAEGSVARRVRFGSSRARSGLLSPRSEPGSTVSMWSQVGHDGFV